MIQNNQDLPDIDFKRYKSSSQRREIALFCCELFSSMKFLDKLWFVLTGEYWGALQRTWESLCIEKGKKHVQNTKRNKSASR